MQFSCLTFVCCNHKLVSTFGFILAQGIISRFGSLVVEFFWYYCCIITGMLFMLVLVLLLCVVALIELWSIIFPWSILIMLNYITSLFLFCLQEIVSIYPVLSPPNLTPAQSNRVCNALALLQVRYFYRVCFDVKALLNFSLH